jgi:hypothetical protein
MLIILAAIAAAAVALSNNPEIMARFRNLQ